MYNNCEDVEVLHCFSSQYPLDIFSNNIKFYIDHVTLFKIFKVRVRISKRNNGNREFSAFRLYQRQAYTIYRDRTFIDKQVTTVFTDSEGEDPATIFSWIFLHTATASTCPCTICPSSLSFSLIDCSRFNSSPSFSPLG